MIDDKYYRDEGSERSQEDPVRCTLAHIDDRLIIDPKTLSAPSPLVLDAHTIINHSGFHLLLDAGTLRHAMHLSDGRNNNASL